MEDDDSWEVDNFEATSDDEGGILIVPVSDNSVSGSSNPQTVVPILYFPNQDSLRNNESESQGEEEEEVEEAVSVSNEVQSSQVQTESVTTPDMFGLASNPRKLIILVISLALFSTVLIVKSFYDHVRYREIVQAAKEKEILIEQIRLLKDENDKLHQGTCWENPTACGRSFFKKNWQSLSEKSFALLGSAKLPWADRLLNREHYPAAFPNLHSAINSAVDTTLNRVGEWKDTAMRKAVSNQEKLSKKFTSLAGFASERFEKVKTTGASFNPIASGLSIPTISNSTNLQTLLNSSFVKTAAVGTVASLLVGALFELEPFAGME